MMNKKEQWSEWYPNTLTATIYLFKVNRKNTRAMSEICSKNKAIRATFIDMTNLTNFNFLNSKITGSLDLTLKSDKYSNKHWSDNPSLYSSLLSK